MRNKKRSNSYKSKDTGKKRSKELEVNIKDDQINKADLKGMGRENDPEWYSHYPTLLNNVTGINFGATVGGLVDTIGSPSFNDSAGTAVPADYSFKPTAISGIMSIGYLPTLGTAASVYDSTANKVAVQLYSAMRQKLGSTASYDPVDTMMYVGAVASAYQLYALGVKIYGCLRLASPFNRYFLQPLVRSMGVDYSSFETNMNDFRAFINRYAIYLTSLMVPADFDYFKRQVWMMQNIFTDSNSAKAQLYLYRMDGFYTYEEQVEGPAYLKMNLWNSATNTTLLINFNDYITNCNLVMDKLLGSSDITQMSADIGKAFDNDVYVLSAIPEDYLTPIVYSQEVLSQFENCVLNGVPLNTVRLEAPFTQYNFWDIIQDNRFVAGNPRLLQQAMFSYTTTQTSNIPRCKANYMGLMDSRPLLNFHKMDITPGDIIVATRGMTGQYNYSIGSATDTTIRYSPTYYGTEVYTTAWVITTNPTDSAVPPTIGLSVLQYINTAANAATASQWSQFDWAPTMWICDAAIRNVYRLQDSDMYGQVGVSTLRDLHTCAVLSEFYSPKFPQLHE